jgi:NADH dehydrogenase/NADH:ubiquinone oxidoreductase subunit G
MMVRLTIDGQIVYVKRQTPILDAAKELGLSIPTLCHHRALKAYGACRLCIVEVFRHGRSKLVTSCNYPAEEGLVVFTATERVKTTRKMVMELLLARCPHAPEIQQLAETMGIKTVRFKKTGDQRCILCGLCVRVCEEMVGVSAISFSSRGTEKEVNTPFGLTSEVCIGCGSCTYICPTGCIEMIGDPGPPGKRMMHMGDLVLESCPNAYVCESCNVEQQFIQEMKRVVERLRSTP